MTIKQIETNWNILIKLIDDYIAEPRKSQLKDLYEKMQLKITTAPASSRLETHMCEDGGYLYHTLNVTNIALIYYKLWEKLGYICSEKFSEEELVFSALNHDLGKLGDMVEDNYILNPSQWHREKGMVYTINPRLSYMNHADRSLYLLQYYGIKISDTEFLAIKLHNGLYDAGNDKYFSPRDKKYDFKNTLPVLLHHADHLATIIEEKYPQNRRNFSYNIKDGNDITNIDDILKDLQLLF